MNFKPCPQCGSNTLVIARPMCKRADNWIALYKPMCKECGYRKDGAESIEEAVKEWNDNDT